MNSNVKSPCDKHGDFFMTRYLISLISALAVLVFLTNNLAQDRQHKEKTLTPPL
jgi:hypothetical protein